MGRHAAANPVDEVPEPERPAGWRVWVERTVLGVAASAGTLLAARWAGAGWSTATWIAIGALVVVPVAAWAAATVPGRDDAGSS